MEMRHEGLRDEMGEAREQPAAAAPNRGSLLLFQFDPLICPHDDASPFSWTQIAFAAPLSTFDSLYPPIQLLLISLFRFLPTTRQPSKEN